MDQGGGGGSRNGTGEPGITNESDLEAVQRFNAELAALYDARLPISKTKINSITKLALISSRIYKHIVQSVERFIHKCRPEFKLPALYVIDSVVRQSRHTRQAADPYGPRFTRNFLSTFEHLLHHCREEDRPKVIRVLNLWQKNTVFPPDVIQPLLDLADPPEDNGAPPRRPPSAAMYRAAAGMMAAFGRLYPTADPANKELLAEIAKIMEGRGPLGSLGGDEDDRQQFNLPQTGGGDLDDLDPGACTPTEAEPIYVRGPPVNSIAANREEISAELNNKIGNFASMFLGVVDNGGSQKPSFAVKVDDSQSTTTTGNNGGSLASLAPNTSPPSPPNFGATLFQLPKHLQLSTSTLGTATASTEQTTQSMMSRSKDRERNRERDRDKDWDRSRHHRHHSSSGSHRERDRSDRDRGDRSSRSHHRSRNHRSRSRSRSHSRGGGKSPNTPPDRLSPVAPRSPPRTPPLPSGSSPGKENRSSSLPYYQQKVKEDEHRAERDRKAKGLPSVYRPDHLVVASTTLWLGHVPKFASESDLSDFFGDYGEVKSINLIPSRGCAYICMVRRLDAHTAHQRLRKNNRLMGCAVKCAWAPGKALKERNLQNYWEMGEGVAMIPWSVLTPDVSLAVLEDGGVLEDETVPPMLQEALKRLRSAPFTSSTSEVSVAEPSPVSAVPPQPVPLPPVPALPPPPILTPGMPPAPVPPVVGFPGFPPSGVQTPSPYGHNPFRGVPPHPMMMAPPGHPHHQGPPQGHGPHGPHFEHRQHLHHHQRLVGESPFRNTLHPHHPPHPPAHGPPQHRHSFEDPFAPSAFETRFGALHAGGPGGPLGHLGGPHGLPPPPHHQLPPHHEHFY